MLQEHNLCEGEPEGPTHREERHQIKFLQKRFTQGNYSSNDNESDYEHAQIPACARPMHEYCNSKRQDFLETPPIDEKKNKDQLLSFMMQ
jgi:hypothetical protein